MRLTGGGDAKETVASNTASREERYSPSGKDPNRSQSIPRGESPEPLQTSSEVNKLEPAS